MEENFTYRFVPSSAIVLVRKGKTDSIKELEFLLIKRQAKISFGNAWAFPGGVVDAQDHLSYWNKHYPNFAIGLESKLSTLDKIGCLAFEARVAGIRELFEECGILLVQPEVSP